MTLPLPHFRQRKRLTNWATGAPGLTPKRTRSPSAMTPRWWQLRHRTTITQPGRFTMLRIAPLLPLSIQPKLELVPVVW